MDTTTLSLIIGITSSLIATFIFIGSSLLIKNYVLPWYEDKIYSGIRIDGEWKSKEIEVNGKLVNMKKEPFVLSLKQNGGKSRVITDINMTTKKKNTFLKEKLKICIF